MDRYVGGEESVFGKLYHQLAPRLFRYMSKRARDAALAEDLVQQTLMQLHATRQRFVTGSDVLPWVYSLARRVLINHFRTRSEALSDPSWFEAVASPALAVDDLLDSGRRGRDLDRAVSNLPRSQRIIIALIKDQGSTTRSIAQELGISINAAKLRRHRACQALRAALDGICAHTAEKSLQAQT